MGWGDFQGKSRNSQECMKQNEAAFRLFYCLPIGPVASSVWVSHRKGKEPEENHGR